MERTGKMQFWIMVGIAIITLLVIVTLTTAIAYWRASQLFFIFPWEKPTNWEIFKIVLVRHVLAVLVVFLGFVDYLLVGMVFGW